MKAGIGLVELLPRKNLQLDIFHTGQSPQADVLMQTIDGANRRYGRGTLFLGAEGIHEKWKMRQSFTSPAYATRWVELPVIKM